ncbi:LOW QUALITY PROTEIN: otoancorin [Thalassophryne amazonica]|uniref:LOW QUALITY PROTEIN: otoancorin n=1 Tax=Thalassophryne amazonica TaxID=390379 RepID=UPI001471A607|nr:LOW QUALITY PROTEIN: otoancorin [Thalassophryne amazonica]
MYPKGGAIFIVLMASAVLAMPGNKPSSSTPPSHFKQIVKKLMKECQRKEFPMVNMMQMENASDSSMSVENSSLCSSFINVLTPMSPMDVTHDLGIQVNMEGFERMKHDTWNCSNLLSVVKLMRKSSESASCKIRASLAPLVWMLLTNHDINNMDLEQYESLLWVAKPLLADVPLTKMKLPLKIEINYMEKLMKMLWKVHKFMSEGKRALVVTWVKEHISQTHFNCSHATRPSLEDKSAMVTKHCRPKLKWLNLVALNMMGPYLCSLAAEDIDSAAEDQLCEFFLSPRFKFTCIGTRFKPSLGKKLLQRIQQCFSGQEEFAQHVDKLGSLACYYYHAPNMTADLSWKFLSQLEHCNNSGITKLKKHLIETVISNSSDTLGEKEVCYLGTSTRFLSDKQLSTISRHVLNQCLINSEANVKWTQSQQKTLTRRLLGDEECKNVSGEDLMSLWPFVRGVPTCVIKRVKAMEVLNDSEELKKLCKQMRKSQLKALLQALCKDVAPLDLLRLPTLPDALLHSTSLRFLNKANISSLDQVEGKNWTRTQASFLLKQLTQGKKTLPYSRLGSLFQGITCKMINKIHDSEALEMAQAITDAPRFLSKFQACCAAQNLFATLEKKRSDYFKTITPDEMDAIPTTLLVHLPPAKVKDLPSSMCSSLLDKIEKADLSLLPISSPSRGTLVLKALLCLSNVNMFAPQYAVIGSTTLETKTSVGIDLTGLSSEDISRLGPLLCELPPVTLRLLAPDVLNSTLLAMASCQHIPQSSRMPLTQLLREIYGNPVSWSSETMEALGCLLFLSDSTPDLPIKPWMKDVLSFLMDCMTHPRTAILKKYFFDLVTKSNASSSLFLTADLIEELGESNVYWKPAQLEQMTTETFTAAVDTLGCHSWIRNGICPKMYQVTKWIYIGAAVVIPSEKGEAKAVIVRHIWGPVSQMKESAVAKMRCISRGFSIAELAVLPFSLDTLENIADCGWSELQMEACGRELLNRKNLRVQNLEAADLIELHHFICGLSIREIQQLNGGRLHVCISEAVESVNDIQCSPREDSAAEMACTVAEFGEPKTWMQAHASMLGNIMGMKMLWKVHKFMSEGKRALVVTWVKEHISQTHFNCSHATRPSLEDKSAMVTKHCRPKLKWLNLVALNMMGPYLCSLAAEDIDSAAKDQVGFTGLYYYHAPNMTADLSWKFLSQLEHCNNSGITKYAVIGSTTLETKTSVGIDLTGLSSEDISRLGPLLCELPPSTLRLLAPDVLNSTLLAMASCQHIPQSSRMPLTQLLREIMGRTASLNPVSWSSETMEALGCLLFLSDSTPDLPIKPWMKDVLSFLMDCMTHPRTAILKKYFFDLVTKSNASSSLFLTADLIEELGESNVYWKPAQLEQMTTETFTAAVDTLGAIRDYDAAQLAVLVRKATQIWGPVSQMKESAVAKMRCISRGFSIAELAVLPFSLDTLENIADCGWSELQMEAVWKGIAQRKNLRVQNLEAADLIELHHFICGLSIREIQQLNADVFTEAVESVNDIQCSREKTRQLKWLTVAEFGEPKTWMQAHASMLGNIMAGLDVFEWTSLDPSIFSFITLTCIPHIPLSALSVQQIEAFGPDNAAMISSGQRSGLGQEQQAALDRALKGLRTEQTSIAGAPSLSVEGISAFIKPFLFLLIGFLLL